MATPSPHNTLYLILDGVSRKTLYALLDKGQLPHIQQLIDRGGYRNMTTTSPNTTLSSYWELLSGQTMPTSSQSILFPEGGTVYEIVKQHYPEMSVGLLLSTPQHDDDTTMLFTPLLANTIAGITLFNEERRSSKQTTEMIHYFLNETHAPFFLMANYTSPEYLGHKYREGAEYYSLSIIKIDRMIGTLIRTLKDKGLWDTTQWWITTNYGMDANADTHHRNEGSWVISTEKIRYKRSRKSMVPTLLRTYHIPASGNVLIY